MRGGRSFDSPPLTWSARRSLLFGRDPRTMWHTLRSIVEAISGFVRNREERARQMTSNPEGSGHSITMIALLAEDRDRKVIADLCYDNHWQVFFAATFEGALRTLDHVKPQIVLFDRDLAGAGWRTVVSSFAALWGGACIL